MDLSYAEGPDNGPPLLLLHAQFLDWFSYSRVLPALAQRFHVFAVDYPGHGETRTAPDYPMTANQIGGDLAEFIEQTVGEPAFISGNSSGGLLAVWLAAKRPELVLSIALEDPPLFSAEYPRIKQTIAYRAFKTSFEATQDHPRDFLLYWVRKNARFFRRNVAPGVATLLSAAVSIRRAMHPGEPVEIGLLRNDTVRMMLRGLDTYDPRFGAAFYDGTWNEGFDHAAALATIRCPTLLMQAKATIMSDGTLNGAMSQADAERAVALLHDREFLKVGATHVVNLDKPTLFIDEVEQFFLGARSAGALASE